MASVVNDDCAAKQVGGVVIKSDLWPDQHRKRVLHTAVSQRVVAGRRAARRAARRAGRRAAGGRPAGGKRLRAAAHSLWSTQECMRTCGCA